MQGQQQFYNRLFGIISRAATAALALVIVLPLPVALTPAAHAQTLTVLYTFAGGADGAWPYAGLTRDRAANLYGTTQGAGRHGYGTVFKLAHTNSRWVFTPLYSFQGGIDGAIPRARVIFGPDGALYGTTQSGGGSGCPGGGCGTVFSLRPPPRACTTALCPWATTVLHRFAGGSDGSHPGNGDLLFDRSGTLYGTTYNGGAYGQGVVFSLSLSNGAWTESVLHSFTGGNDGSYPYSGVIFDNAGNLYGAASAGGSGSYGTVYELTPAGAGWQEKTLYSFPGESAGKCPVGGLIFDASGNLYGTTAASIYGPQGEVYELTPSNGDWTLAHVAGLPGGMDSSGPVASLVMDAGGSLYGTAPADPGGGDYGMVFQVFPDWYMRYLWVFNDFGMGFSKGYFPDGSLTLDANGNLYGTNQEGGAGYGVVFELTP